MQVYGTFGQRLVALRSARVGFADVYMYSVQPRREGPLWIVAAEVLEAFDESDLCPFAGIVPIAREMIGHAQEIVAVLAHDFAKTVCVSS